MFNSLLEWDKKDAKKQIKDINCPTLCILTDEHHCSYQRIKQENSNLEIGKVICSKCWATLEAPDQVNSMIKRFLESCIAYRYQKYLQKTYTQQTEVVASLWRSNLPPTCFHTTKPPRKDCCQGSSS